MAASCDMPVKPVRKQVILQGKYKRITTMGTKRMRRSVILVARVIMDAVLPLRFSADSITKPLQRKEKNTEQSRLA